MIGPGTELPPTLAAVSVSVSPGRIGVRGVEVVKLLSQLGPIFQLVQTVDQWQRETLLIIFSDTQTCLQAVQLFDHYSLDATCVLNVKMADRPSLQLLAQVLVKCLQVAPFASHGNGTTTSAAAPPPLGTAPVSHPAPGWATHLAPTALTPHSSLGGTGSAAATSQQHQILAAAAAAAWGRPAPPSASSSHPSGATPAAFTQSTSPWATQQHQQQQLPSLAGPPPSFPAPAPPQQLHPPPPLRQLAKDEPHHSAPAVAAYLQPSLAEQHDSSPHAIDTPDSDGEMLSLHLQAAALRRAQQEFLEQHRSATPVQDQDAPVVHPSYSHGSSATRHLRASQGESAAQHTAHQAQQRRGYVAAAAGSGVAPAGMAASGQQRSKEHRVLTVPRPTQQAPQAPQAAAAGGLAAAHRGPSNGAEAEEEQGGWEEVGSRGSSRRSSITNRGPAAAAEQSGPPSNGASREGGLGRKLYVRNLLQPVKAEAIRAVFSRFGSLEECVKFPETTYAFVHFRSPDAAAAAFAALNDEALASLSGDAPLVIEFRAGHRAGGAWSGRGAGGAGRAAAVAGSKQQGSAKGVFATYEGSISRDPSRQPLPSKKHDGDAEGPTTKLWVGGISGDVREEKLKKVFGSYGPVYGVELRAAPEVGRRDQWAFVNYRRLEDCQRAFREMADQVIPELTGIMRLKLRYKVPNPLILGDAARARGR